MTFLLNTFFYLILVVFASNPIIAMEKIPIITSEEIPKKYAINLMWIHGTSNENPYICRLKKAEEASKAERVIFEEDTVAPVHAWAAKNPHASIFFWYDSNYSTREAVKSSKLALCTNDFPNVTMRDIRELKIVKDALNESAFASSTPVYFRSDLLRPIIQLHLLKEEGFQEAIYSDLDVTAMTYKEIFEEATRDNLRKYGIVMASGEGTNSVVGYENSFMIVSQDRLSMLEALNEVVIRSSIARARQWSGSQGEHIRISLPQVVFYFYKYILEYANYLEGNIDLYLPDKEGKKIRYNPSIHHNFLRFPCFILPGEDPSKMLKASNNSESIPLTNENLPTKAITMKPQGGKYY